MRRFLVLVLLLVGGSLTLLALDQDRSSRNPKAGSTPQAATQAASAKAEAIDLAALEAARRAAIRREALARSQKSLDWADAESHRQLEAQLVPLDRFFSDLKTRTPKFAGTMLGWGSKWRFVADKVPFTRGGRHEEFLRKNFNEQLFRSEDLTRLIEQVAQGYADALMSTENQMLVRMRADVGDLPTADLPGFADPKTLQLAYDEALDQVVARLGPEVRADVALFMVSLVAQEVVTQVAVRLGVSAGVLGTGAATSWATFGIGLVVCVIVDQIICWAWDRWTDPKGQLAAEMNTKFDELHRLLVDGEPKHPGLRARFQELALERGKVRRQAVASLFDDRPTSSGPTGNPTKLNPTTLESAQLPLAAGVSP
jgi:hypothetical protein